jgi:hypothetical protein
MSMSIILLYPIYTLPDIIFSYFCSKLQHDSYILLHANRDFVTNGIIFAILECVQNVTTFYAETKWEIVAYIFIFLHVGMANILQFSLTFYSVRKNCCMHQKRWYDCLRFIHLKSSEGWISWLIFPSISRLNASPSLPKKLTLSFDTREEVSTCIFITPKVNICTYFLHKYIYNYIHGNYVKIIFIEWEYIHSV